MLYFCNPRHDHQLRFRNALKTNVNIIHISCCDIKLSWFTVTISKDYRLNIATTNSRVLKHVSGCDITAEDACFKHGPGNFLPPGASHFWGQTARDHVRKLSLRWLLAKLLAQLTVVERWVVTTVCSRSNKPPSYAMIQVTSITTSLQSGKSQKSYIVGLDVAKNIVTSRNSQCLEKTCRVGGEYIKLLDWMPPPPH